MFFLIINQILKMLLLMLLGYGCCKWKLIDEQGNKMLANLLLMVVNPILAVMSLQVDFEARLVSGLLVSYLLAIATHLGAILLSQAMVKKTGSNDLAIERFSAVYSNCGFMGIPLVQSTLGAEGVLYLTAYMTVFNICSWTHGIILMTGTMSRSSLKRGLLSPMVIACFTGLILFFSGIRFPATISDTLTYVSNMNTPLAMIIAGVSVAQTDILQMLKKRRIYYISFIKLLVMPAAVLAVLALLPVGKTAAYTILIAAACPCAATCTAFALRFQKNYTYSSEIYAFSTLCSLVTIPLFICLAELLLIR